MHIDFIKILAILLVIFIHTGNEGFLAYQKQSNLFIQIFQIITGMRGDVFDLPALAIFLIALFLEQMEREPVERADAVFFAFK